MKHPYDEQELERAIRRTRPGGPPKADFAAWRHRYPKPWPGDKDRLGAARGDRSVATVIRLGRTLVRGRRARFGAIAAAIIVLAMVLLGRGTNAAWSVEQTIAAMKKVKAIHITGWGICEGQPMTFNFWVQPPGEGVDSLRIRYQCGCRRRTLIVVQDHTMYRYFPAENSVTVGDCSQLEDLQYWYEAAKLSPWLTGKLLDVLKLVGHGWQQTPGTDPVTGREQIEVTCSHPPSNVSFLLVVDPQSKLVQRAKLWKNLTQAGEPLFDAQVFTYNPELPDGFFEFQIPEGATVVSEGPKGE